MKNIVEFRYKKQRLTINYLDQTIVAENFLIERLLPTRTPNFEVRFSELGRNSISHPILVQRPLSSHEIIETIHGRIWLGVFFPEKNLVAQTLDEIWIKEKSLRIKEEHRKFMRNLTKGHPVANFIGISLLLVFLIFVVYYFLVIFPNL
ncbi:MAG: hypothetical protein AB3N63_03495 [Puniceicoccaceae bacterium]